MTFDYSYWGPIIIIAALFVYGVYVLIKTLRYYLKVKALRDKNLAENKEHYTKNSQSNLKMVLAKYGVDDIIDEVLYLLQIIGVGNERDNSSISYIFEVIYKNTSEIEKECKTIESKVSVSLRKLRDSISKHSGLIEDEDMRILEYSVLFIEREAENLLCTITDIYQKIRILNDIQIKNGNTIDIFEDWHRKQIIKLSQARIKAEHMFNDKTYKRQMFSSKNNAKAISRLSATTDGNTLFAELFNEVLTSFGSQNVCSIITSWKEYYSEAGSDLFMCACMDFDAFKYFLYYEKQYFNTKNQKKADIEAKCNREELVLALLIAQSTDNPIIREENESSINVEYKSFNDESYLIKADGLVKSFCNYKRCQMRRIKKITRKILVKYRNSLKEPNNTNWENQRDECLTGLKDYLENSLLNAITLPGRKPRKAVCLYNMNSLVNNIVKVTMNITNAELNACMPIDALALRCELLNTLHLWDMVLYMDKSLGNILVERSIDSKVSYFIRVKANDFDHFRAYYLNKLSGIANKMFRSDIDAKVEPACEVISHCFDTNDNISDEDKLRETLLFTLRYYYKHQFRIHMDDVKNEVYS